MQNSDIATLVLCAIGVGFTAYVAYAARQVKRLDRSIEARELALEVSKKRTNPSPAE